MKQFYIIIFFLLAFSSIFFTSNCNENDWRNDPQYQNKELEAKLQKSKTEILSKKKKNYELTFGYNSKQDAIKYFLEEIQKSDKSIPLKSFISWSDQVDVIFPNTYGFGTALDSNSLEDYKVILYEREKLGMEMIHSTLSTSFAIQNIEWEKPRFYNELKAHKPKVVIRTKAGLQELTQIKMVYEIGNKYIVGVVGP
ncbi:hypothetical protein LEP1GSC195_3419 [Leptospira wolbachii serovar Codice str. CDC]|uniref:Lipoprotein n=1 Tax=Leptospira wolbachii serovar Codice str. CDC TaxID=1218599 RepID=R9A0D9_9LEPT|nr:hypothetical protein [Leptospira wolbachii]EOQ95681.1 hypothetical protein LEP1GSC195_3419 [Leptospira wolbachii serovar Codice str. CDC]